MIESKCLVLMLTACHMYVDPTITGHTYYAHKVVWDFENSSVQCPYKTKSYLGESRVPFKN